MNNDKIWTTIARIMSILVIICASAIAYGVLYTTTKTNTEKILNLEQTAVSREIFNLQFQSIEKSLERNDKEHIIMQKKLDEMLSKIK